MFLVCWQARKRQFHLLRVRELTILEVFSHLVYLEPWPCQTATTDSFHEYAKQPKLFGVIPIGKPIPTVELISIALVNEDGTKHFYAEADWYNKRAAKKHLFISKNVLPNLIGGKYIMSKEEIKKGILDFIGNGEDEVELIGWWSAYDWVVFCQLFGSMTKTMPKTGFWYYTDLKTMLADTLNWDKKDVLRWTPGFGIAHNALDDAIWLKNSYFKIKDIIKQNNNN